MKTIAAAAVLFFALLVPAEASPTTYYWHQTWASLPGLSFSGHYTLVDPAIPVVADSGQSTPDLSLLLGFYVQGGQVEPVRLSDLVPTCWPPGPGCILGLPSWTLDIVGPDPSLRFFDATASYDYTITADAIAANTDRGGPCFRTGACQVRGFWSTAAIPLPASLLLVLGGLMALFGSVRAGRGRIRS